MIDIWSSTGLHLPRQLSYADDVSLPVEETLFLRLCHDSQASKEPISTGIWGEMVRLARIWAEIHDLNKASVEGSSEGRSLNAAVAALSQKLQVWSASLPPQLQETSANLERYASVGLGSAFAALHLGFHYYNQVLFYQFLAENDHHSSISAGFYAGQCAVHAMAFCDLLYTTYTTPGCECFILWLGTCWSSHPQCTSIFFCSAGAMNKWHWHEGDWSTTSRY